MNRISYILVFCFITWMNFCFSQNATIDSLKKLLVYATSDTAKIKMLNNLCWEYRNYNTETAIDYCRQALYLAQKINNKTLLPDALSQLGLIYTNKGNYDSAKICFDKSIETANVANDKHAMAQAYGNLGNLYGEQGNNVKCMEYYMKAVSILEAMKDTGNLMALYANIGVNQFVYEKYDEALKYYFMALDISKHSDKKSTIANITNNIGVAYFSKKEYDKALKYFNDGLKMHQELDNQRGIAYSYDYLGSLFFQRAMEELNRTNEETENQDRLLQAQRELDEAIEYFQRELGIYKKLNLDAEKISVYSNLATIESQKGNYKKALEFLNQSIDISNRVGQNIYLTDVYKEMASVYEKMDDYKNAYMYFQKYTSLKDTVFGEESQKQITEMQIKYETEKKEQQITLLNKEGELQKSEVRKQKIIIWSVIGGLLLVVILSLFIFRERRKSEKLLLNILPAETAKELKAKGKASPRYYESVTVMFTDFKDFTGIAEKLSAEELVNELDFLFKKFDKIISKYPIEKIKTIGDSYMCVGGLPTPNNNHAENIVKAALEIQNFMKELAVGNMQLAIGNSNLQTANWQLRIGVHTGPVVAGVVGEKKFAYDIWGDTVNTASRMESSGEAGKVNISGATHLLIKNKFTCAFRGKIPAKNKGEVEMYFVEQTI